MRILDNQSMHSTSIFLLVLALLVTVATARPWPGHLDHGDKENEGSQEDRSSTFRVPSHIRLPGLMAVKLGQPLPTFTAKKILNGNYLIITPALIFKLKEVDNDPETSTDVVPEVSTTVQPDVDETTTVAIGEEIETTAIAFEENTTIVPSFSFNGNEQFFFPDD
jgi:hypothetical protein